MAEEKKFDGNKMVMTIIFIVVTAVIFLAIGYVAGKVSNTYSDGTDALESSTVTDEETIYSNIEDTSTTSEETTSSDTVTADESNTSITTEIAQ